MSRLVPVIAAAAMLGACAELRDMMRDEPGPGMAEEGAGAPEAAGAFLGHPGPG